MRDYERRNANRKSVLQNIERKLSSAFLAMLGVDVRSHHHLASRPHRGDVLELTVDRLAYGGNGVARREDGYVVFVAGGVPGDRVRAEVGKSKKAYAEARAIELLEPSPDRIPEVADHPGAPWQVLPFSRQLEVKQEQVADALTRIGRLEGYELEPIVPAVEEWRYRNKLEYSFGTGEGGELRVRLPRARALGRDRPGRRLPARLRARQRRPRAGARRAAAPGARRLGPPPPNRASCATSSCARGGEPASCRCGS